jgi:hypothetical protein
VPGTEGDAGLPGTDGTDGVDAFTTTTSPTTLPAINALVLVDVVSSLWMVVGQKIFIGDGTDQGTFDVVTKPSGVSGAIIATGSGVSPSGTEPAIPSPTAIADGGTGSATATTARAALGVGGDSLSVYAAGTVYSLTATPALLDFGTTDPSLVINAPGVWLILARARIDNNAKTTAAVRTITLLLRRTNNTAANIANSSTACKTAIMTTLTFTLAEMDLPPIIYTTVNSDDILQVWGSADDISGAGTFDAVEASIVAVRLYNQTV